MRIRQLAGYRFQVRGVQTAIQDCRMDIQGTGAFPWSFMAKYAVTLG